MHVDLLVFLAAAWLGPALADGRRTLRDPSQVLPALSLAVAGLAASWSAMASLALATMALALAAVLVSLGLGLARDGRRAGFRRLATAGIAGVLAVLAQAVLGEQPVVSTLAGVSLPAAMLLMLVPATAGLEHRLREHDAGARPPLVLRRSLSTGVLAFALVPVLQALPGSPW
jgi:hypothetical protein